MERETIDFEIQFDLDWQHKPSIAKIREDLDAIEELGATNVNIETSYSYEVCFTTINAIQERLETEEEFAKRLDIINQREKEVEKREIELLNYLKLKYNL